MNLKNLLKKPNILDEVEWVEFAKIMNQRLPQFNIKHINEKIIKEFYYVFNQATIEHQGVSLRKLQIVQAEFKLKKIDEAEINDV